MANILIVDDAAFMRQMLKDILIKAGHHVVSEAEDGEEAIQKYKTFRPDLTTMDITMPNMEGIEALRAIRQLDPKARIIMCTSVGHKERIIEAIQSGAKDFIVKPFQASRVLEAIGKAL